MDPTTPPPLPPATAPDQAQSPNVDADHPCVRCGYQLRGLPVAGNCPECAMPVAESLKGFVLASASPEYIATIKSGATIIVISMIAQVVFQLASVAVGIGIAIMGVQAAAAATPPGGGGGAPAAAAALNWAGIVTTTAALLGGVMTVITAVGYWRFTAPDPGYRSIEKGTTARKVVRVAAIVIAVSTVLSSIAQVGMGGPGMGGFGGMGLGRFAPQGAAGGAGFIVFIVASVVLGLVVLAAWGAQFFGSMLYVRWLAPRIPDPTLVTRAKTYIWLLPLIYVLGSCLVIGPLIAMIMWSLMLWQIRTHLADIQRRQMTLPA